MCGWGLPKGTRGDISAETLAAAKEHHRKAQHRISRKECAAKIMARGKRKPVHVMRARVRRLNAGVPKRQRDGVASIAGWNHFKWPYVVTTRSKRRAFSLMQGWSCVRCGMCTRKAASRKSHEKHC